MAPTLHRDDPASWIEVIWDALPNNQSDDISTAMAWLTESLGLDYNRDGDLVPIEQVESEAFEEACERRGENLE